MEVVDLSMGKLSGRNELHPSISLLHSYWSSVTVVVRCAGGAVAVSGAALCTRSATNVWLVGQPLHCIEPTAYNC